MRVVVVLHRHRNARLRHHLRRTRIGWRRRECPAANERRQHVASRRFARPADSDDPSSAALQARVSQGEQARQGAVREAQAPQARSRLAAADRRVQQSRRDHQDNRCDCPCGQGSEPLEPGRAGCALLAPVLAMRFASHVGSLVGVDSTPRTSPPSASLRSAPSVSAVQFRAQSGATWRDRGGHRSDPARGSTARRLIAERPSDAACAPAPARTGRYHSTRRCRARNAAIRALSVSDVSWLACSVARH